MNQLKKASQLYMLEFVIFHLFLLVAISFISYIFMSSISSIFNEADLFSKLGIDTSAYLLTGIFITLPVAFVFGMRTRLREAEDARVKRSKVRRFFLYLFLLIYFVTIVYTFGGILNAFVQNIISIGAGADWGNDFWNQVVTQLVPLLVATMAFGYIYKDGQDSQISKMFMPALMALAAVGIILLIAFPIRENRGGLADAKVEKDLTNLQTEVSNYASENGYLPDTLADLDLDSDLAGRASDYEYRINSNSEYELCATFNTDTSSSYSFDYPAYHEKGRDCFTETVYTSSYGSYLDDDYDFEDYDFNLEEYGL